MASKDEVALPDLSNWMTNLPVKWQQVPLTDLPIPGSHDSFTYNLNLHTGICESSLSPFLQKISKLPFMNQVLYNWSVTQRLDVTAQLAAGVRYFDVRVASKVSSAQGESIAESRAGEVPLGGKEGERGGEVREMYCVHALYGSKIAHYLQELKQFLLLNPKEVVLLDLNHFYDMTSSDHQAFSQEILQLLGNMVCPTVPLTEVTLEWLWQGGYQVVVFYAASCNTRFFPSSAIRSRWPDQTDAGLVLRVLNEEWQRPPEAIFKVYQGVLTPSTNYVIMRLGSTLRQALLESGMLFKFVEWVRRRKEGGVSGGVNEEEVGNGDVEGSKGNSSEHQFNIFIADFVEVGAFVEAVMSLFS